MKETKMANQNPVALFELDGTDKLMIQGTASLPVIDLYDAGLPNQKGTIGTVAEFRDRKGRRVVAMIEQIDGDRFWFTSLPAARCFMEQHGMIEVDDKVMDQLRNADGSD